MGWLSWDIGTTKIHLREGVRRGRMYGSICCWGGVIEHSSTGSRLRKIWIDIQQPSTAVLVTVDRSAAVARTNSYCLRPMVEEPGSCCGGEFCRWNVCWRSTLLSSGAAAEALHNSAPAANINKRTPLTPSTRCLLLIPMLQLVVLTRYAYFALSWPYDIDGFRLEKIAALACTPSNSISVACECLNS